MFGYESRRDRKARLKLLEEATAHMVEVSAKKLDDDDVYQSKFYELRRLEQIAFNHFTALRQDALFRAAQYFSIPIPEDCYSQREAGPFRDNLTLSGERWLNREIRQSRMNIVKDWMSILGPTLSSLIGLLGVVVAILALLHKH